MKVQLFLKDFESALPWKYDYKKKYIYVLPFSHQL